MFTRRELAKSTIAASVLGAASSPIQAWADDLIEEDKGDFGQLLNPSIKAIDDPRRMGYAPPSKDQIDSVQKIIDETTGSTPVEVAQSFVDRFYKNNRSVIAQWPAPQPWNPLIVRFFREATSLKANNDMVDWCAAFANWCIKKAGKHSTNSAASQSFVSSANGAFFKPTSSPKIGDIVVWTCYGQNGKSLGLGHVGFYKGPASSNSILLLSGNTASDGLSSLICVKAFSTQDRTVFRTVNGQRVPCTMRLNSYLEAI